MFKRINICLDGPLCTCTSANLKWDITMKDNRAGLLVRCGTCGTRLDVPNEKFVATFVLDRLYPIKHVTVNDSVAPVKKKK